MVAGPDLTGDPARPGGFDMARHSHLPPAQRVDLVLAVLRGTEKLEVLARRHQVSANTLRRWRDEFVAAGRDRLTGRGDAAAAALENQRLTKELAERELIIGEITVANRFLQKKVDGSLGTTSNGKS
jgi:transposase